MEIEFGFDSADIERHEVQVEGVNPKGWFWPSFHTSDVFPAIAPKYNFVFDIMLY